MKPEEPKTIKVRTLAGVIVGLTLLLLHFLSWSYVIYVVRKSVGNLNSLPELFNAVLACWLTLGIIPIIFFACWIVGVEK